MATASRPETDGAVGDLLAPGEAESRPALGAFRARQGTLFEYDPCRAHSERTCWACPLERCRRHEVLTLPL